ncbi:tRNA (guanine(9)-N1)-methyltransferase-like [Rhododendron vialii]|uniref:tRNA (guanine(9)-N1)-methyltransferase-like n=1 Tax=Rhododendron vialii TaxID=182163 RepID=UPI00265EF6C3|nr:tRNA (guanine(9)-N1)-methyltransferase-like [Rhododendron vialii]
MRTTEEEEPLQPLLSGRAQKKKQKFKAKKAQKKALVKEQKKREGERKRKEWEGRVAGLSEEEREKLIGSRNGSRKERMAKKLEERESKVKRLNDAKTHGQNIVVDLEFVSLMTPSEINSLVHQILNCYAMNGRCSSPGHLWLTGCHGEMEIQLQRLPGFNKWIIEKENRPYIEAFQDRKKRLVYLTTDSENILEELDPRKIYIVGGLVERNRWKGITKKKAKEQGIKTAKLPIGNYMKMSGSKVLTVNQVIEILLKFLETRDWKTSFFKVIPQRKRCEADSEKNQGDSNGEDNEVAADQVKRKKKRVESAD